MKREDIGKLWQQACKEATPEVHALDGFAALVLEKAAQVCDVTPPEPFRPSIEAAHALRQMAKGLKA